MTHPLEETYRWFTKAVPEPSAINQGVQLACHFEEVGEMLETIQGADTETSLLILEAKEAMDRLSQHLKVNPTSVQIPVEDRKVFLDAVSDQIVTGVGSAYMQGMDPVGGLTEVNASNWSKFVDGEPQFDENKKIKKGPDYCKPDLSPFV